MSVEEPPAPSLARLSRRDSRRISVAPPTPLSKSFLVQNESFTPTGSVELASPSGGGHGPASRQQSMRGSIMRQSSVNRSTKFDRSRRRMTKIDPNLSITEITKLSRATEVEKKKLDPINRKEVFKFECEGEIQADTSLKGMHVKWKASFDRPIEELIYPSLQRFDNDTFEEKRKQYENLHGHSRYGYSAIGRTTKLDMIDGAENPGSRMMFIHAPKWTMTLENRAPTPSSPSHSPSKLHDSLNEMSLDGGDSLTLSVDDIPRGGGLDAIVPEKPTTSSYRSLQEEIEAEGEKILRQQVVDRYHARLEEDELRAKIKAEEDNYFHIRLPNSKQALLMSALPPVKDGDGDHLVSDADADAAATAAGLAAVGVDEGF